jgi:hypothetical protein
MSVDPELVSVFGAGIAGVLVGLPTVIRASRSRKQALEECLHCGRIVILGERTCDCGE